MNKKLAIPAITLVAVVMGLGTMAPAMADHRGSTADCGGPEIRLLLGPGATITHRDATEAEADIDRNGNGSVCQIDHAHERLCRVGDNSCVTVVDDYVQPVIRRV